MKSAKEGNNDTVVLALSSTHRRVSGDMVKSAMVTGCERAHWRC